MLNRPLWQATNQASFTIDKILNKGADKLYDRYISNKIKPRMQSYLQNYFQTIFTANLQQKNLDKSKVNGSSEPGMLKTNFKRANRKQKNSNTKQLSTQSKTIDLNTSSLINSASSKTRRAIKWKSLSKNNQAKTKPDHSFKNQCGKCDLTDEQLILWKEKSQKYNKQQAQIQEKKRKQQETKRWRRKLEEQFQYLESNNKTIAFDYESGGIIDTKNARKQQITQLNKDLVKVKYRFSSQFSQTKQHPQSSPVKDIRKVNTFIKTKKRLQQTQQTIRNFSNNGQRQTSSIPFIDIQQGITISENSRTQRGKQRPSTSITRGISTAKSFKSYTHQMMKSMRGFKTITDNFDNCTKKSKRYQKNNQDSILWNSKSVEKNHRISLDPELAGDYFNLQIQTIE